MRVPATALKTSNRSPRFETSQAATLPRPAAPAARGRDVVELAAAKPGHPAKPSAVRSELVAKIRKQIEAGRYMTEAKLEVAMERLLEDMSVAGAAATRRR